MLSLRFAFVARVAKHSSMKNLLRAYLGVALALSVALASFGHAQARNQAHGATTLVICTGYGLVRITMDIDGKPVEQTLPCPDCILTLAALPNHPLTIAAFSITQQLEIVAERTLFTSRAAGLWHLSRAPPVPV